MRLICGDSSKWVGDADLVFTNPYGPLPKCLHGKPAIIVIKDRAGHRMRAEKWIGARLSLIGNYNDVGVFVSNLPSFNGKLDDLEDGEFFPLELPLRLLRHYGYRIVWDGFMGRGTVGMACRMLGLDFIGIDIDPARVELARQYLG